MIPEANGPSRTYKLDLSGQVAREIKQLVKLTTDEGQKQRIKAALREVFRRLRSDPQGFGELIHFFKNLHLLVHVGVIQPLLVRFAIHEEMPLVFIIKVQLLDG